MAYEAPRCCGANLRVFASVYMSSRVTANGKPSMRSPSVFDIVPQYLFCIRCETRYEAELDSKGRIVLPCKEIDCNGGDKVRAKNT